MHNQLGSHFSKLFGLLVATLVVMVGVLNVRVENINGDLAAISTQVIRTAPIPTVTTGGANAALTAYYVVCEEADKGDDPGAPAGTVIMAFTSDPGLLSNVHPLFPPYNGYGSISQGGNHVGDMFVYNDQAIAGSDYVPIEPGTGSNAIVNGKLQENYCDPATTGSASAPKVVSALNAIQILVGSVLQKRYPTKTFSSGPWTKTMTFRGGASITVSGNAHRIP